jgi:hypothetical protein
VLYLVGGEYILLLWYPKGNVEEPLCHAIAFQAIYIKSDSGTKAVLSYVAQL